MKKWMIWAFMALVACDSADSWETTDSGLRYSMVRDGDGPSPKNDEVMLLHFKYEDDMGNVMYNTDDLGGPAPVLYNDSLGGEEGNIEDIFHLLSKGDSLLVKMNAEKLFTNTFRQPLPDSISNESDITFYIGVEDIMSQDDYNTYRMALAQKMQEEAEVKKAEQLAKDVEIIEAYLAENSIEAVQTESGLHYVIHENGSGPKPEYNDQVDVDYVGYLLDGTVFDTSKEDVAKENGKYQESRPYGPYPLALRKGGAIDGWVEGMGYFNEGTKATLYVPSTLAYGEYDMGDIGPNSVLAFDVEIVKVTKAQ